MSVTGFKPDADLGLRDEWMKKVKSSRFGIPPPIPYDLYLLTIVFNPRVTINTDLAHEHTKCIIYLMYSM